MPNPNPILEIAEILGLTESQVEENLDFIKDIFGSSTNVEEAAQIIGEDLELRELDAAEQHVEDPQPKAEKIKCKCCGFYKKPRKSLREYGICKPCLQELSEPDGLPILDGDTLQVVGRQGKRGRNSVSFVDPRSGRRWKVKRLSNRHSENVAKKYAAKPKGYARKAKRTSTEPVGIRTDSRIGGDRVQRTHEN